MNSPERVAWQVVEDYAKRLGLKQVTPHDLRRSCAKLRHAAGGELDQIQFLLRHVSVKTAGAQSADRLGPKNPSLQGFEPALS